MHCSETPNGNEILLDIIRQAMLKQRTSNFKVISGGQSGVDQAALFAAKKLLIPTGGYAPKNYYTEDGPNYGLKTTYGLDEHPDYGYIPRSKANVDIADVTVVFRYFASPGSDCTIGYAQKQKWVPASTTKEDGYKPVFVVTGTSMSHMNQLVAFIRKYNPSIINFAGHRQSTLGKEKMEEVVNFITRVLYILY